MRERLGAFEDSVAAIGARRDEAVFAVNRVTYVAPTDEEAWEIMPQVVDVHRGLVRMLDDKES